MKIKISVRIDENDLEKLNKLVAKQKTLITHGDWSWRLKLSDYIQDAIRLYIAGQCED